MVKLIRVQDSTWERLAKEGRWGDSMDSIILKILGAAKESESRSP
jgi:hypothetical protein